jgi:hypothetical protein
VTVIRFELNDGPIVYTDRRDAESIMHLCRWIIPEAQKGTVMDLRDDEYFRLPILEPDSDGRAPVSRWEGC